MSDITPGSEPHLERVVVALDFSEASILAATWVAQHFARGTELVLVHVIHAPAPPRFLEARYPRAEQVVEMARAGAELRLRELVSSLATGLTWTEVRIGRPDEEIVRVAQEYRADLIVVGRPAPRTGLSARLGTTAQRVLRRATVPVLLAVGMPAADPLRVLVGLDESDLTEPVLDWTRLLVERFKAETVVMHVIHPRDFDHSAMLARGLFQAAADSRDDIPVDHEPALRDAERWIGAQLEQRLGAKLGRGRVTAVALEGLPSDVLLAEARRRDVELIVLGSRGAGTAQRLFLGSVAEAVLRDSPCPVLVVVRPEDAA